ncbi:ankyrin repeat domain-containing protein [Peribacillus sp. SCS-37]|uniref:ankyrin repeat domain-containing protein n=1 Tax=Paraperibacillus esterisolvens TaxID=3115296 RepID=UPI00390685B3
MNKKRFAAISLVVLVILSAGFTVFKNIGPSAEEKAAQKSRLVQAAASGDLKTVKKLTEELSSIQFSSGPEKKTPLEYALGNGNFEVAGYLLKHGAKHSRKSGNSLLVQAVSALPEYSQTMNQPRKARNARLELLKQLVKREKGGKDGKDAAGNSALHLAAGKGDGEAVSLLLKAGLKSSERNLAGKTPVELAVLSDRPGAVKAFAKEEQALLQTKNGDNQSLWILAATGGAHEILYYLGKHLPEFIDEQDDFGKTALIYASEYGDANAAAILLEAGASRDLKSKEGFTARDYAAEWKHENILKLLNK